MGEQQEEEIDAACADDEATDCAFNVANMIRRVARVCRRNGTSPMCEYDAVWFTYCFPTLFPYGIHQQDCKSIKNLQVCLLNFTGHFAIHPFFSLCTANRYQRQQVAWSSGRFVTFKREYAIQMIKLLSNRAYRDGLRLAVNDPTTPQALFIWRQAERYLTVSGSSVPWSPLQRRASVSELLAYMNYYGLPSYFLTVAFDDGNQKITLQVHKYMQTVGTCALPHLFPVNNRGEVIAEANISMADVRRKRNDNSIALPAISAASFFFLLHLLLNSSRKTLHI